MIKKKKSFLGLKPLTPKKLKSTILILGASFIKFAQVLATRADFFTTDYLVELKDLHDQLPAMKEGDFEEIYEKAFSSKNPFASFDKTPIASASIGQVHRATLQDGTTVAVKIRRKEIERQVSADIRIINFFNLLFNPLFSFYTKNSIEAVISEFTSMIKQEVNFKIELQNLLKFSQTYQDVDIRFPVAYQTYCSEDALVMSFEEGFRFDDKENILAHDIDFHVIIAKLVSFYTRQMLINGYFHADPHPGNLLVTKEGGLVLLDFGMVKTVPNETRIAIIELVKAANEQNYELYISANKRLGTIAYEAPTAELAEFVSKMFDIFSNEHLSGDSMQELAFEVMESMRDFPFKLPSDAIYILRVSAIIEGLGTTYIDNFNGIKDILPILQKNIPRALGAKENILEMIVDDVKELPFIVKDVKTIINEASQGELKVEISHNQLHWIAKVLKEQLKSTMISFALMFAGLFTLLYHDDYKVLALVLFSFGFVRIMYK